MCVRRVGAAHLLTIDHFDVSVNVSLTLTSNKEMHYPAGLLKGEAFSVAAAIPDGESCGGAGGHDSVGGDGHLFDGVTDGELAQGLALGHCQQKNAAADSGYQSVSG